MVIYTREQLLQIVAEAGPNRPEYTRATASKYSDHDDFESPFAAFTFPETGIVPTNHTMSTSCSRASSWSLPDPLEEPERQQQKKKKRIRILKFAVKLVFKPHPMDKSDDRKRYKKAKRLLRAFPPLEAQ